MSWQAFSGLRSYSGFKTLSRINVFTSSILFPMIKLFDCIKLFFKKTDSAPLLSPTNTKISVVSPKYYRINLIVYTPADKFLPLFISVITLNFIGISLFLGYKLLKQYSNFSNQIAKS